MCKKIIALLCGMLMLAALFAGCSNSGGKTADTTASTTTAAASAGASTTSAAATSAATTAEVSDNEAKVTSPGTLPIVNEPLELSFGMPINAVVEDRETNELWKYLQEQTGITFILEEYASDEFLTKVDLMVAAGGEDLPNIVCGGSFGVSTRTTWGQAGFVQDLKPYIDELCYFLPIAYDNCEYTDWNTALTQITSFDGCIYGLPSYAESPNDRVSQGRINFYLPWVEKAGMLEYDENGEFFTRVDQVLDYYEMVKNGDFNENETADEIPLTGYGTGNIKYAFLPMFMHRNPDAFYIDTATNTVKYNFNTEEYREGLAFIKSLFDKGYLDPLTYTQDHAAMTAMITADTMTVASFMRISASNLNLTTVPPSTDFAWASALAAPGETDRYQYYGKAIAYTQWLVTCTCENVEAAVRLGDYWGSEECSFINNCGFEGIDYDWVADLDDPDKWGNVWGWGPEDTYIRRTTDTGGRASWGTLQNVWMSNQGVSCLNYAWATQGGFDKSLPTWDENVRNAKRILHNIELTDTSNVLAGQVYSQEETDILTEVYTSISTYAAECFVRFTMGDMDLERDWDNYIAELEAMGLQQVIDAENSCYDRMYK